MIKIAVVTKDGERISSHFGTAQYYHVFTIDDSGIVKKEIREKPYNPDPRHVHARGEGRGHQHGRGFYSGYDKYQPIRDCQVLIAGGMGENAYQHATSMGFKVILVGGKIEDAINQYLDGNLKSDMRRVH